MSRPTESETIKKASCCFFGGIYGVLEYIKDGKLMKVERNRDHTLTLVHICERVEYS